MTSSRRGLPRPPHRRSRRLRCARGAAFVETIVAVPMVLLLGLGALQWAMLFHARTAIEYALIEAGRAGSVAQARPDAIEAGLARGLMPFWQGVDASRPWSAAVAASKAQLQQALASGWIAWRQLAPTVQSFADWGQPALDAAGYPDAAAVEIPNDSLQWSRLRQPAGGVGSVRGDEPIGAISQQTLNDANLLKLELRYGAPMTVPLVGRIAVWLMRIVDGCATPSRRSLGTIDLGTPAMSAEPRAWACAMYLAPDASGIPVPRWPVRVSATIRMQSPARRSAMTPVRTQSPHSAAFSPAGTERAAGLPTTAQPTMGSGAAALRPGDGGAMTADGRGPVTAMRDGDGSLDRSVTGWLRIGGERTFSVPGACT